MTTASPYSVRSFLKAAASGLFYVLGAILFGMLAAALHTPIPDLNPPGTPPNLARFALCSALMGLALLPLVLGTSSRRLVRALFLFLLLFVCLGINSMIEVKLFTTYFVHGGMFTLILSTLLPALLCSFALSCLLPSPLATPAHGATLHSYSPASWLARILLAILAFPLAYLAFGMAVGPFVVDYYRSGSSPLILPPLSAIMPLQVLRSSLFLLASAPFLFLWTRSRASLVFALGLAHWYLVGLFGLLQVTWFPPHLRVLHSLEIGADSFAYAAALVFLFVPRRRESTVPTPAHVAPMFPS